MIKFEDLVGKTITSAKVKKLKDYNDDGFLALEFSDGTAAIITSYYGEWSGDSLDEYPTHIDITDKIRYDLIDIE